MNDSGVSAGAGVARADGRPDLAGPDQAGTVLGELDFTIVDVETTGWSPQDAGITEIGAVRVHRGRVAAEFTSLVNPGIGVPESITALTGISDEMLAAAPAVAAVLPGLLAFAEGSVLTAHNARFDLAFLTAACAGAGLPWPGFAVVDTVRLARHLVAVPDEVPDCKLRTLAGFFGSPSRPSHRALADARATADVLACLIGRLAARGVRTLGELTSWLAALEGAEAAARTAAEAEHAAAEAAADTGIGLVPWLPPSCRSRPRSSGSRRSLRPSRPCRA